ncbi:MAG TPA: S8 family serine peptidase [Thermoanaerobaculia bacterium]|nr:S8 family serine peptidase [Thermoanaerobaculia bacterium]
MNRFRLYILLNLFVLLVFANASADAAAREGWVKATVKPLSGPAARLTDDILQELRAVRIGDYPAFTVVLLRAEEIPEVREAGRELGFRIHTHEEWDTVSAPRKSIDVRVSKIGGLEQSPPWSTGEGTFVVQFIGPLTAEWSAEMEVEGLRYISYLPYNSVIAFGPEEAAHKMAGRPGVQWIARYDSTFRAYPRYYDTAQSDQRYVVQIVDTPGNFRTTEKIQAWNVKIERTSQYGPYVNLFARLSAGMVEELLLDPYVVAVEYSLDSIPSGEREAIAATETAQSFSGEPYQDHTRPYKPSFDFRQWLSNRSVLDTSGYNIAVADTGLDADHPDINRSGIIWHSYVSCETAKDTWSGHGTAVTGFAVGDPSTDNTVSRQDTNGFYWGMGLAPKTKIYVQKIFSLRNQCPPTTTQMTWANDAYYWKSVVQTHSHNQYFGGDGVYNQTAQEYDYSVRDTYGGDSIQTQMPVTVSAGNICGGALNFVNGDCSTMVLSPATAKNVITVGAAESWRPDPVYSQCDSTAVRQPGDFYADSLRNVAYLSRRGTADGRIKPDLIAPGTMSSSTSLLPGCNNPNSQYFIDSGTSFAAPQVAAAVVLLNKKKGSISCPSDRSACFSPAMLKAALAGNALSVKDGLDRYETIGSGTASYVGPRPNAVQGFGRLSLGEALRNGSVQTYLDEDNWVPFTSAGQTRYRTFTVADTSQRTIVVLAWSDEPAAASANKTLVRDLNMEISASSDGCFAYTGNHFMVTGNELSAMQGGPFSNCGVFSYDSTNNIEMIVLPPNADRTTFTLDVFVTTWGSGSPDQKFAVFLSNAY